MDMPEVFNSKTRKANKQHKCCECGITINAGDKYVYSSGIWSGTPDSFKQCINCSFIMNNAGRYTEDEGGDGPCFRGLREWFREYESRDFTGEEFLTGMAKCVGVPVDDLNKLLKIK